MLELNKFKLSGKPKYKKLELNIDYINLAEKMDRNFDNFFILESLGELSYESRYVVMGFEPDSIIYSQKKTSLIVDNKEYECENSFDLLKKIIPQNVISRDYAGGLVGYMCYESINLFENSLNLPIMDDFGLFKFGLYTDGIILDKYTGIFTYFYYFKDRFAEILDLINKEENNLEVEEKLHVKKIGNTINKEEHEIAVKKIKEEINKGNTFQCEVGFKSLYEIKGNKFEIFKELRKTNPSPYMYYMKFKDKKIIGASPETLLRIRNDEIETTPLAGTIGRGENEKEDKKLAAKMLSDEKEISEHNMLVDLHRNDIGKVSRFGSVKVRKLHDVVKFSFLQHLSSTVVGLLDYRKDQFDAIAAILPGGVLTGAPKIESIKIINRNEIVPRGPYGGAIGIFGFNGDCTMAAVLRSLYVSGNSAYSQTCSGIVYDSVPEKEYEEIMKKLAGLDATLKKYSI